MWLARRRITKCAMPTGADFYRLLKNALETSPLANRENFSAIQRYNLSNPFVMPYGVCFAPALGQLSHACREKSCDRGSPCQNLEKTAWVVEPS